MPWHPASTALHQAPPRPPSQRVQVHLPHRYSNSPLPKATYFTPSPRALPPSHACSCGGTRGARRNMWGSPLPPPQPLQTTPSTSTTTRFSEVLWRSKNFLSQLNLARAHRQFQLARNVCGCFYRHYAQLYLHASSHKHPMCITGDE